MNKNPTKIDRKFLMQFPEFVEFQRQAVAEEPSLAVGGAISNIPGASVNVSAFIQTPTESLEFNYRSLRSALAEELLDRMARNYHKIWHG